MPREVRELLIEFNSGPRGAAHNLYCIAHPCGVYNPKVLPLKREGQSGEELENIAARGPFDGSAMSKLAVGLLLAVGGIQEPAISGLPGLAQDVELVIAQDALGILTVDKVPHVFDNRRTIGPSVAEVADKDQSAILGVITVAAVTQAIHKRLEGVDLTVDIADHIDRAVMQSGNERVRLQQAAPTSQAGSTRARLPILTVQVRRPPVFSSGRY